jgi:hypothetical protein
LLEGVELDLQQLVEEKEEAVEEEEEVAAAEGLLLHVGSPLPVITACQVTITTTTTTVFPLL